jgi:predicted nucleic acid-binding protein
MRWVRGNCFDASALVRVFIDEPGYEVVRPYFHGESTKYTTPFCFYEALNVLKSKWIYRKEIDKATYLKAAVALTAWYGASSRQVADDLQFEDHGAFAKVREIVSRTNLDFSDAFQIVSVKFGYFSHLGPNSKTILVTCDRSLAEAARAEGLKVWNALDEPAP